MDSTSLLFNPHKYDPAHLDAETRELLRATIEWFETRGLRKLTEDFHRKVFYQEFLDFVAEKQLFAKFLTPEGEPGSAAGARWDTSRNAVMSEVLGFYGLNYWYPWQVAVLGLGPVWQSQNPSARKKAAEALATGEVAAFGLSEKEHGADVYSTSMRLTPSGDGYVANGGKYYIGNGNCARIVSVFGRIDNPGGDGEYVFFRADSEHPSFELLKNVVASQMYVAEFRLNDYPVSEDDILHRGDDAFSAAMNTVNVGKFNLCFGGIGLCTHAFYEAITHASNRVLYGKTVTSMPHVRAQFIDSYARLLGMRLFSDRAIDYFRTAHADDRRYLLYNAITKMKVTSEAETVMAGLAEIVAAKGFEKDNYLTIAVSDVRGLPKLEGTVAVNLALINKFMPAYLFSPADLADVPAQQAPGNDDFLFHQGPARGLGKVRFHDWRPAYKSAAHIPNVAVLSEQIEAFTSMLTEATPSQEQIGDMDFMLAVGQLFTLVVYGHLILEQARIAGLSDDVVDHIFSTLVRDFSSGALGVYSKRLASGEQQKHMIAAIRRPASVDDTSLWNEIAGLSGVYAMRP
ncbi:acyl-CoA/acyl-ACP dehydrogenase [Hoyosella sp. YIM 151337]|uniref:acyl-CoA dehydrogenase family protein n=1 Tax=Hoyosella sp. YIM 151337 TaxID=2992742 RepID=UPI0022367F32|nr:acyl-CoA dehydrogenase family protein [Hoyosella sp. YIM 151337]MCW4354158.1 acyl-CoA/acyl-ACP dehydrogenase [Hoyosella sp. YIM 151337]